MCSPLRELVYPIRLHAGSSSDVTAGRRIMTGSARGKTGKPVNSTEKQQMRFVGTIVLPEDILS